MHSVEVALLHWPRDREDRERLARALLPRLLLVSEGQPPPGTGDPMEDWIRLPADERDVAARLHALSERATASLDQIVVVDDCCLRRSAATVSLSPNEASFARLLVAASGGVVPRAALAAAVWGRDADPSARSLDDLAYRLRRRIEVLGLDVVTARTRGFALHILSPSVVAADE